MMRLRHTPALLAFLGTLGALNCSDPGNGDSNLLDELERIWAPAGAEPRDLTPENCRNVAVQRHVRVGEASGESSCQFDASTSSLSCRTALGSSGELTTTEFASLSDFIEAGRSRGKVTSSREVRTAGKREIVTEHEYDELGRLIVRREARPEGDIVYSYADFDDAGRPRSAQPTPATLEQWGCAAAPLTIEYGDARVRYQYRPAAGCGGTEYSVVERFDVSGNLIQSERFSPAGVEVMFEAGVPSATQLFCD
jgi:hypothetical protein